VVLRRADLRKCLVVWAVAVGFCSYRWEGRLTDAGVTLGDDLAALLYFIFEVSEVFTYSAVVDVHWKKQ
jgi:hypothetical protein